MHTVSTLDEKELLLLLKQGNEKAFERIYNLHSSRPFGNIYKMVKSESTSHEILQDFFLKIWNSRASIGPERTFRSYLFRIAENNVYDFFRKAARDKKLQTKLLAGATNDPTFPSIGRGWMFGLKYHFTKTGGTDQ
ncbi:MAG TPA: sigma factor [Chitinophagaceae bacterium]|nr:sigma factor [Chitinophagaceae bacterium]